MPCRWRTKWRHRDDPDDEPATGAAPSTLAVAGVTFANGGDNVGVYVPVFAVAGVAGVIV